MSELTEQEKAELQALVAETHAAKRRFLQPSERNSPLRQKETVDDEEYARRLARSLQRNQNIVDKERTERISRSLSEWRNRVGPTFAEATTEDPVIIDRINRLVSGEGRHKTSLVLSGGMGVGKAQPISEPILTPNGFVPMGSIQPGDYVIGRSGLPVAVNTIHPQGERDIYKVTFNDDSYTFADYDHLWTVQNVNDTRSGNFRELTTGELLGSGLVTNQGNRKYKIPMVEPVQFSQKHFVIQPYTLGVLLGDGFLGRQNISFSTRDKEILERITLEKIPGVCIKQSTSSPYDYRFSIVGDDDVYLARTNPVKAEITRLGLYLKKSFDKFIPKEYLFGSVSQRIDLLRGLMDSDGETAKERSWSGFSTISPQLAEDFVELVQSLGGTAKVRVKTNIKGSNYDCYRITVSLKGINPFFLPRKANNFIPKTKYAPSRHIKSIEYSHKEEAQCISVDAEDNLYITRGYIVTHNTWNAYSFLNLAIANGIATPGQIVADTETSVLGKITSAGYKKPEMLDALLNDRNKIWFVDDVGQGFFNDPQKRAEVWFELLDHIYTHQLTLLITTNLSPFKTQNGTRSSPLENWIGPRAFDRLRAIIGHDGLLEPSKVNRRDRVYEEQEKSYQGNH